MPRRGVRTRITDSGGLLPAPEGGPPVRETYRCIWPETAGAMDGDHYRCLPVNISVAFQRTVDKDPDRMALSDDRSSLSYAALAGAASRAARALQDGGAGPGDVVGILCENRIPFVIWYLGALLAGAEPALLNVRFTAEELSPLLALVRPRIVVADRDLAPRVRGTPARVLDAGRAATGAATSRLPGIQATSQACAALFFTSGTTGIPKAARLSHRNLLHSAESYRRIFGLAGGVTLIAVPLFHVTGLIGQWLPSVLAGGGVVLMPRFEALAADEVMRRGQVDFFFGVPTIFIRLLRVWEERGVPPALMVAASGGAPIPATVLRALAVRAPGARIYNTYGMTEVASPATILPAADTLSRPESAGRPAPGVSLRVVDPSTLRDVGPGASGELLIAGPMVMGGYHKNVDATRNALLEDGRTYMRSGDVVRVDGNYVYVVDRLKDLINRGGEKIFGGEVEQALYRHPDVLEASVVGVPDPEWGEVAAAAVVYRGQPVDPERMRGFLKESLAAYKVPTRWRAEDELPRNVNGKVDRRLVRGLFS